MKKKSKIKDDEYFAPKIENIKVTTKRVKQNIGYLLGLFGLTFLCTFGIFLTSSYFNSNAARVEATALCENTNQLSEITLKSKKYGTIFPHDVFPTPHGEILYLQESYPDIKTIKMYNSYESKRKEDWVNGFFYLGDQNNKPESTYYDKESRYYTDFLCLDDGEYLGIDLLYSSNMKDDKPAFLKQYSGNEIYLPYNFALNTFLPIYKTSIDNPNLELQDLLNKEITLYTVEKLGFGYDNSQRNTLVETPKKYSIKGIITQNVNPLFENRFIIPFRSELLTQARVHFIPTTNAKINYDYLKTIKSFDDTSTLKWGVQTPHSEVIGEYLSANIPAKKVGIYGCLTLLVLGIDMYVFALYLKKMQSSTQTNKTKFTIISLIITFIFASIISSIFVQLMSPLPIFSWKTKGGTFTSSMFNVDGSSINILFTAFIVITCSLITYFKLRKKD